MNKFTQLKETVLNQVAQSPTPHTMIVCGMLSDVQEMISRGHYDSAISMLNSAKIIVDTYAPKDREGRHNADNDLSILIK
jgi:hypothetical protein